MLDEIRNILTWYSRKGDTATIPELLTNRDRLELYGYRLAEWAAELLTAYNEQYFMYRIGVAKKEMDLIKAGTKIGEAKAEALVANEDVYKEQILANGDAYRAKELRRQVNRVADAMSQRISYLKEEANRTHKQDMT